jgi:SAM-dependent methyltransferase
MAATEISNPRPMIGSYEKDVPWYNPNITNLSPSTRELLETYSKVPAASVEDHVLKMVYSPCPQSHCMADSTSKREEAWQIWPYPCIGTFRFLHMAISQSSEYPQILERLKTGNEYFLDLGCFVGQEIRRLVADGARSENLYGADLRSEFFDLGHKFFKDRDTLKSTFIAADIFDPNSRLKEIDGKIDIVYTGAFLHLFGYDQQLEVCIRIVKLLRPKKGSLLAGRQVGHVKAGVNPEPTEREGKM